MDLRNLFDLKNGQIIFKSPLSTLQEGPERETDPRSFFIRGLAMDRARTDELHTSQFHDLFLLHFTDAKGNRFYDHSLKIRFRVTELDHHVILKAGESVQFSQGQKEFFVTNYAMPGLTAVFALTTQPGAFVPVIRDRQNNYDGYIENYAYDASNNLEYWGLAVPGSSNAAAVWKIFKNTLSGNNRVTKRKADGDDNYDNVWNDYASLSYS